MPKFALVVTDRLTGKSFVYDYFSSRKIANEAAFHLEQRGEGLHTFDVIQEPETKRRKKNPCKPCGERQQNPVPPSKKVQQRNAADLYERFTGHKATESVMVDKPVLPDVMLVVGDIDFIGYTTVRDGVTEKYIHKFKKNCRPLFTVSHDGKLLFMLGGSYDFTELGIVDRT